MTSEYDQSPAELEVQDESKGHSGAPVMGPAQFQT